MEIMLILQIVTSSEEVHFALKSVCVVVGDESCGFALGLNEK